MRREAKPEGALEKLLAFEGATGLAGQHLQQAKLFWRELHQGASQSRLVPHMVDDQVTDLRFRLDIGQPGAAQHSLHARH